MSQASTKLNPRVIVTQDGEGDDKDSMVRFLLYSCDFDVVGIVENNSISPSGNKNAVNKLGDWINE